MARLFSVKDIELLGYSTPSVISDTPGWMRISATLDAGLSVSKSDFVYLRADCTTDQAEQASRETPGTHPAYVLLAPGHKLTEQGVRSIFAARAIDVLAVDDAIWRRLSSIFATYLKSLSGRIPDEKFFVRPRREREPKAELDQELRAYLSGRGNIPPGTIAVLTAAAGVGKTTVARRATLDLVKSADSAHVIPVFVEATHWSKFNLESNLELWDIIRNSIDHFSGPIAIGQDLFNYGIQQGYFVFVFDGFDELCSPKHSQFSPLDVLRSLSELASQSDARILITTRALFWQNEIEKVGAPANVSVLTLAPFNKSQALGYFQQRFKTDPRKRDQAQTLYSRLVSHSDLPENEEGGARSKFANLPLVVVMLAEYIDRGGVAFESQGLLIEDLLCRLCLRDQARQDLIANAQEQLRAFESIAVTWYETVTPEFDTDVLELVGFPRDDIRDIRHHALVAPGRLSGTQQFRWDFLAPYMRALYIRRMLQGTVKGLSAQAYRIMQLEANGKGFVFEHLCGLLTAADLPSVAHAYSQTPRSESESRSFLVHLVLALLDADRGAYKSIGDRTNAFLEYVCGSTDHKSVIGLTVIGQIERLDLRGVRFEQCDFRDAAFVSCNVDGSTVFDQCSFYGTLELVPQDLWGAVVFTPTCNIRPPAALTVSSIHGTKVTDPEELVLDAFRLGLGKFWHNGSPRGDLKRDDWRRGLLGRTKYCQPVLEALMKSGVVMESAKGQYSEPRLFFEKGSFGDLQRFMDNRQLTGKVAEAFRIVLKWNSG